MRKSTVTWRLAFNIQPSAEVMRSLKEKLDPIARAEKSAEHDMLFESAASVSISFLNRSASCRPARSLFPASSRRTAWDRVGL